MIEMAAQGIRGMLSGEWLQFKEMKEFADVPQSQNQS
jgi:hypothetical protein